MNKLFVTILTATSIAVGGYAETPIVSSVAHVGPNTICLGDPVTGSSETSGYHLTQGHVQGIIEVENISSSYTPVSIGEGGIHVYPNPVEAMLHIDRKGDIKKSQLTIYSNGGIRYLHTVLTEPQETIDASPLPAGIYILTISEDNEVIFKTKIIKR